jgi:hypothetical protein
MADAAAPAPAGGLEVRGPDGEFAAVFVDLPAANVKVSVMAKGVVHLVQLSPHHRAAVTFNLFRQGVAVPGMRPPCQGRSLEPYVEDDVRLSNEGIYGNDVVISSPMGTLAS